MANLGFVGLGVMGSEMVNRLLSKGHSVTGYNRTRSKAEWLLKKGMKWADSPRAVVAASDVIFSMVTNSAALSAVMNGPDGMLAGAGPSKAFRGHEHGEPGREPRFCGEGPRKGQRHDGRAGFRQRDHLAGGQAFGDGGRPQGNVRKREAAAAGHRAEGDARRRQRPGAGDENWDEPEPCRADAGVFRRRAAGGKERHRARSCGGRADAQRDRFADGAISRAVRAEACRTRRGSTST